MPPRIEPTPFYNNNYRDDREIGSNREADKKSYSSALYGGLGAGQALSLTNELRLPSRITSIARRMVAGVPRLLGSVASLGMFTSDVYNAYRSDQLKNNGSYRHTKQQVTTSLISTATGMGVGSLAGYAAAGALVMGAPISVGVGIGVLGVLGAGIASSYAYDWAEKRVNNWFN